MKKIIWLQAPLHVTWYVTSKCNLRCKHCYLTNYTQNPKLHSIIDLIEQLSILRVNSVSILGGEPLIRKDLELIIKKTTKAGIQSEIATNAVLVNESRARTLAGAGCKKYQVSLEGYNPETSDSVRGKGTFHSILAGIKNLKLAGSEVTINVTVTRANYRLLAPIAKLAESIGASGVRFSAYVPITKQKLTENPFALNEKIVQEVRIKIAEIARYAEMHIDGGAFKDSNKQSGSNCLSFGCGAGTHNMVINADMSLAACDLDTENERTFPVTKASDIQNAWKTDLLFQKWRGLSDDPQYSDLSKYKCHLAYKKYGKDIFV